jgi:hypothetical protein
MRRVFEEDDLVLDSQLLAFEVVDDVHIRERAADFLIDLLFDGAVLCAERLDSIVQRHGSSVLTGSERSMLTPIGPWVQVGYARAGLLRVDTTINGVVMSDEQRLIVGISGASGVIYGVRLLEMMRSLPVETHLVMSRAAEVTVAHETSLKVAQVHALAHCVHPVADIARARSAPCPR